MVPMRAHMALSLLNPLRCHRLSQLSSSILRNRCASDFKNCLHVWEYLLYSVIYLGMEFKFKHKFHLCFTDTYSLSLKIMYTLSWVHLGLGCDPLCEVRHGIFHCGFLSEIKTCQIVEQLRVWSFTLRIFSLYHIPETIYLWQAEALQPRPKCSFLYSAKWKCTHENLERSVFFSPNFILQAHNNTNYSSHSNKFAPKNSGCLMHLSTLGWLLLECGQPTPVAASKDRNFLRLS